MIKRIMFSKYFGYSVGGAEISMLAQAKAWAEAGDQIEVVRVTNVKQFNAQELAITFPKDWQEYHLTLNGDWPRFKFIDYCLSRKRVAEFFAQLPLDRTLVCYGLFAPAAMLGFKGSREYYIRDELGAGVNANYYRGWRGIVKRAYMAVEWPFYFLWRRDLLKAASEATKVVVNAKFMAKLAKNRLHRSDIEVLYSRVQVDELKKRLANLPRPAGVPRVVTVGDNILKGANIVRAVAELRPQIEFHIFDRKYDKLIQVGNLFFHPWAKEPLEVYRLADILMAPSQWLEAYPRVVMEAASLGLPILASTQGGIPEAVERHGQPGHAQLLPYQAPIKEWALALDNLVLNTRI